MSNEGQFAPARPPRVFGKRRPPDLGPTTTVRPIAPDEPADLEIPTPVAAYGFPFFTVLLIALLCVVFVAELALNQPGGKPLTPSVSTLYLMGASSQSAILDHGEWWRLFTAPLLHANASHIAMNCLALLLIGWQLEPIIGFRWMAGTFAISAICGSLASVVISPANIIGIGASGGIVGIFVVAVFAMVRMPHGRLRSRLTAQAVFGLASALLPVLSGAHAGSLNVDYGAHFGGAISGAAIGLSMLFSWAPGNPQPETTPLAAGAAGVFFAIAAWSIVPASQLYATQSSLLAPNWPSDMAKAESQADELSKAYPKDPRAMFAEAIRQLRDRNLSGAEASLRAAVADSDAVQNLLAPQFVANVKATLAATVYDEGRRGEAVEIAHPICNQLSADLLSKMQKANLCS